MMFELFTLIICLAVVFFLAGFYFENYPTFMVSGFIFMVLSLGIFTTGLTQKTGEIETQEVPCEWLINESCSGQDGTYNLTTVTEYQYTSSEGLATRTLGMFLLVMAFFAFGCAVIYATPKKDRDNNPDHEEWNYY